eukprot:5850424-Prymnesium_polylepis.2
MGTRIWQTLTLHRTYRPNMAMYGHDISPTRCSPLPKVAFTREDVPPNICPQTYAPDMAIWAGRALQLDQVDAGGAAARPHQRDTARLRVPAAGVVRGGGAHPQPRLVAAGGARGRPHATRRPSA